MGEAHNLEAVILAMVEENECNSCHKVLFDTVASGYCSHRFCQDCLRKLADEQYPRQGQWDLRCSNCDRLCLHNMVDLMCPECKTTFCYKVPMPNECFFRWLMSTQKGIGIATVFTVIAWIFNGSWLKAFFCVIFNGILLVVANTLADVEVKLFRHCCKPRRKHMFPFVSLLTVLACCALLLL